MYGAEVSEAEKKNCFLVLALNECENVNSSEFKVMCEQLLI